MKRKVITELFFLLSFFYFSWTSVWGQVTIGNNNSPAEGAILQLKQDENLTVNSAKGLGLPRVILTDKNSLFPMFKGDTDYENNTNNKKADEDIAHTGLVVYNLNTDVCEEIYAGIQVWDGKEWILLGDGVFPSETDILIDTRDPAKTEQYKIGKFGDAGWWMLENLRAEIWPDGNSTDLGISKAQPVGKDEPAATEAHFYYPNFDENQFLNNPHHGYMYNFHAAARTTTRAQDANASTAGQGICPNGWHLPAYNDWVELVNAVYKNPCQYAHSKVNIDTGYNMQSKSEAPNGVSRTKEQGGFDSPLLGLIVFQNGLDPGTGLPIGPETWWVETRANYWISDTHSYFVLDKDINRAAYYSSNFGWVPIRCKKDVTRSAPASQKSTQDYIDLYRIDPADDQK